MANHRDRAADGRTPRLTAVEIAKITVLTARMAKRGLADDRVYGGRVYQGDLERRVDRILDGARAREEKAAKNRK
ncbi:DUF6257 family protein [Streptomyces sp. NPDC006798]|uniref:DUF6257 family protein n=1 Tax=Streptomyces sp. NPDC006798 TaxID=3155462 RepID=UPI0034048319